MSKDHYFFELATHPSALFRWFLMCLATLVGGLSCLLALVFAQMLLKLGGLEQAEKHGISQNHASRLGGVLVYTNMLFSSIWFLYFGELNLYADLNFKIILLATLFFILGLFEDLSGLLKARHRFVAMLSICASVMLFEPQFILTTTGLVFFDHYVLVFYPLAMLFSVFGVAFFVNAFNTADGANGLVSSIAIVCLFGLADVNNEALAGLLKLVAIGCGVFMIYNVLIGRIFMGDGGAYFLGALIAVVMIVSVNNGSINVWYALCLAFYPHADLLFSIARRFYAKKSILAADNGHLHNLIYKRLSSMKLIRRHANTLTGLSIGSVFSLLPYVLAQFGSINWIFVYMVMWLLYLVVWFKLRKQH